MIPLWQVPPAIVRCEESAKLPPHFTGTHHATMYGQLTCKSCEPPQHVQAVETIKCERCKTGHWMNLFWPLSVQSIRQLLLPTGFLNIHSHLYSRMRVCYSWKVQIPRWLACVWVLPGRYEVVPHLFSFHANRDSQRQITSGIWSILRYRWSASSFQSGQGSMLIGFGFGPTSGIEIGNSGEVGSLMSQQYCLNNKYSRSTHPWMTKLAQRLLITLAISQSMGERLNVLVEKR